MTAAYLFSCNLEAAFMLLSLKFAWNKYQRSAVPNQMPACGQGISMNAEPGRVTWDLNRRCSQLWVFHHSVENRSSVCWFYLCLRGNSTSLSTSPSSSEESSPLWGEQGEKCLSISHSLVPQRPAPLRDLIAIRRVDVCRPQSHTTLFIHSAMFPVPTSSII